MFLHYLGKHKPHTFHLHAVYCVSNKHMLVYIG